MNRGAAAIAPRLPTPSARRWTVLAAGVCAAVFATPTHAQIQDKDPAVREDFELQVAPPPPPGPPPQSAIPEGTTVRQDFELAIAPPPPPGPPPQTAIPEGAPVRQDFELSQPPPSGM